MAAPPAGVSVAVAIFRSSAWSVSAGVASVTSRSTEEVPVKVSALASGVIEMV